MAVVFTDFNQILLLVIVVCFQTGLRQNAVPFEKHHHQQIPHSHKKSRKYIGIYLIIISFSYQIIMFTYVNHKSIYI